MKRQAKAPRPLSGQAPRNGRGALRYYVPDEAGPKESPPAFEGRGTGPFLSNMAPCAIMGAESKPDSCLLLVLADGKQRGNRRKGSAEPLEGETFQIRPEEGKIYGRALWLLGMSRAQSSEARMAVNQRRAGKRFLPALLSEA